MNRIVALWLLALSGLGASLGQTPTITSFSPQSGSVPTRVTIRGSNFSPTPANNIVRFGTALATPSVTSADSIYVTAPGNATYGPISVTVAGKTGYFWKPFFTTFSGGGFTASSFQIPASTSVSSNSQTMVYADLDGDGKLDIVLPQNSGQVVRVARNTTSSAGNFTFAASSDLSMGWLGPRGVATADIDGDGKLDLAVACQGAASPGRLALVRNTGTPGTLSFAASVLFRDTTDFLYIPYDVAIADFDKDGRPDIVTAGQLSSGYWVHVFRNISSVGSITTSSLEFPVKFSGADNARRVRVADFDGDGKIDILVSTNIGTAGALNLHRNTTTGSTLSFASPVTLTPAAGFSEVVVGDLNGDGKPDVIACNAPVSNGTVSVFENVSVVGDITFLPPVSLAIPQYGVQVDLADVDGDAKPDIVVMGSSTLHIFRNISAGGTITTQAFAPRVDLTGFSQPTSASFAVADLDADAKPEVTIAGYGSQASPVVVMKNRISSGFNGTPITTGTSADIQSVSFITRNNGCFSGRGGVVRVTTDGGTTWTSSTTGTTSDIFGIRLIGTKGFIVGAGGLICVSTNNGGSWTPFSTGTSETFNGASFTSETAGWAVGTNGTICRYNGTSWTAQPTGTTIEFKGVFAIASTGYAVGAGGTICKWNGSSWVPQSSGTTTVTFSDVAFLNDQVGYAVGTGGAVFKTTNGGTNWTSLTTGLTTNLRSIKLADANIAWAVGDGGVVAQTSDGGVTWTVSGLGVDDLLGIDFVQGQGVIVGKSGKGFRFTTTLVGVREDPSSASVAEKFLLQQNYPNPFNPSTRIRFSVAPAKERRGESGIVVLKVYDILGREVRTLVNEARPPGDYEVTFDATGLASGIYFYRLQSNQRMQTRKMMFVR